MASPPDPLPFSKPVQIQSKSSHSVEPFERTDSNSSFKSSNSRLESINRLANSPNPNQLSTSFKSFQNMGASPSSQIAAGLNETGSYSSIEPNLDTVLSVDIPKDQKAEIVKKHLVMYSPLPEGHERNDYIGDRPYENHNDIYSSSHRLAGGDVTREVYKWQEDVENEPIKRSRSRSFYLPRPEPSDPFMSGIREPGGFRRHFIHMKARQEGKKPPNLITRNFIDFLTMYGHFAGEDLSEDEDGEDEDMFEPAHERLPSESSPLISKPGEMQGTASASKAVFLLLKSFVGTGVIFLPKAFYNGGMIFSSVFLVAIAAINLFSYLLLVDTRAVVHGSFGDIGGILYGPWMRFGVLFSITISQIGFVCAYMIFVAENLQALMASLATAEADFPAYWFILGQVFVFVPLAMIRKISRLSFTALIADMFILFGLLYLYYYDLKILSTEGIANIQAFNPKYFAFFVGTAVFTFEGIGLVIPITESMKEPEKFPKVLTGVMALITVVFTSMGVLSYAAFGDKVQTVVILNLPADDPIVRIIQLFYSLAIVLSVPLQLFPAIRIMENGLFTRSGKHDPRVKWLKNLFRFMTVVICALIAWGGASDLDKFVALIGSFACIPLCFLYPPLFHLKAVAKTFHAKLFDLAVFIFGVIAMVYTTFITLSNWGQ